MAEGLALPHKRPGEVITVQAPHIDMVGIEVIRPLGVVIGIPTTALTLLAHQLDRSHARVDGIKQEAGLVF